MFVYDWDLVELEWDEAEEALLEESDNEGLFAEYLDLYIPRPDIFLELESALIGLRWLDGRDM